MRHLAGVASLVAVFAVAQAGCGAAHRSGPRELEAREQEHATAQINAQRSCEGVPATDLSPGLAGLNVRRITVLERPVKYGGEVVEGAAAVVAMGGRSFDSMKLLVTCRAARAAVAREATDSLAVPHVTVRVYRDDGEAVIVEIRSGREDRAKEIVRRLLGEFPTVEIIGATVDAASREPRSGDTATQVAPPPRSRGGEVPPTVGPRMPNWFR